MTIEDNILRFGLNISVSHDKNIGITSVNGQTYSVYIKYSDIAS